MSTNLWRYPVCGCDKRLGCATHGPQPRDQAVPCAICRHETWNVSAECDRCLDYLMDYELNAMMRRNDPPG